MLSKFFRLLPKNPIVPQQVVSTGESIPFPFYIKATLILLGIYLLFNILLILQDILVPVCFALLISILLNPLVNKLIKLKVPRVLGITISILAAMIIFGSIIFFLAQQFASFADLGPELSKRGNEIIQNLKEWVNTSFGVSLQQQEGMISSAMEKSKSYIGSTLLTVADILSTFILLPIYVFLMLYYKPMFINFFYEVFDYKHGKQVSEVLTETKSAVQSYIVGLLTETCIVAVLNSVALLIIGVEYAILLGVVGAILNLIPYIGGLVAIILPVVISMVTSDTLSVSTPLIIVGAYTVIQFIDNNIIVPKVVSSKVEVNAFISIIIVLLGGALWGVSGMFLSIPFVAILKIIFDRIEELKPWGMLLGTEMNPDFSLKDIGTTSAEAKSVLSDDAQDDVPEVSLNELKGKAQTDEEN